MTFSFYMRDLFEALVLDFLLPPSAAFFKGDWERQEIEALKMKAHVYVSRE